MKTLFRPRRQVAPPEALIRHQNRNPLFTPPPSRWSQWRRGIIQSLAMVVGLGLLGLAIYGPWLRVTTVQVTGTQALDPDSIIRVTNQLLDGSTLFILPRRNLWLVSRSWLSNHLKRRIQTRLSVEQVLVTKKYPDKLTVTIHERVPAWTWQTASQVGVVDRHGIVMSLPITAPATWPVVRDAAAITLAVDQPVVDEAVVAAMATLQQALNAAAITVEYYSLPTLTCPTVLPPRPTTNTSPEGNVNAADLNVNVNAAEPTNSNTTVGLPCDLTALHRQSQEIHLKILKGPEVYFDRHEDLSAAVQRLQRVLAHPDTPITSYVDLRFGDHVYIK